MRVLVCGGRDFTDEKLVFRVLDDIDGRTRISFIIEGGQRTRDKDGNLVGGADLHACRWSYARGRPGKRYDANWHPNGRGGGLDRSAGPKRNRKMLEEGKPDLVIAFPGGSGTANMVMQAEMAGIPVERIQIVKERTEQ